MGSSTSAVLYMHECVNSGIAPNERNDSHAKSVFLHSTVLSTGKPKAARFEDHVTPVLNSRKILKFFFSRCNHQEQMWKRMELIDALIKHTS